MGKKAIVAMSGGVDSSVAAALLKQEGFDVTGIMMKLWQGAAANNESGCCSLDAAEDARRVSQVLDIPFYVFNFAQRFSETVIENFIEEYGRGRTPNPCVECNRSVKFSFLMERAMAVGADILATGHYARIDASSGRARLLRGKDPRKDQSYVLHMLKSAELAKTRFPVGDYSKSEIRQIAHSLGLRTAEKPESQEICFVPSGDSHAFLSEKVAAGSIPGSIVRSDGSELGHHRGFAHYTVGQRRGLGLGVGLPLYVKEVHADTNTLVVASKDEMQARRIQVQSVSFVDDSPPPSFRASVMTRYRGPEASAEITAQNDGSWIVDYDEAQGMPAPGQAAVFYSGNEVLGGGTIAGTIS